MLADFGRDILKEDALKWVRAGLIGEGTLIPNGNGKHLVYADYVASGRALRQVEDFIVENVLPFYANTHSDTSFCGIHTTALREEARATIARLAGADDGCAVIFTGSGATAGLNRLVGLLGVSDAIRRDERPVVFIGPYEHHSNILPWRESGAVVVNISEAPEGGPDLVELEKALIENKHRSLKIGAFSVASNVSGILTSTGPVTCLLRAHGALSVWDYAAAAPYVSISMIAPGDAPIDAIVLSPHKFPGGPGASGILIVRKSAVRLARPTWPGGGTVRFVSAWNHDYVDDLAEREEAGTPNIIGDIRAGLAFLIKDKIGQDFIRFRDEQLNRSALAGWWRNPNLILLGAYKPNRLPIFSFLVRDGKGGFFDPLFVARQLSDRYGIQSRGGCSCAGIYGHRLLGIDCDHSDQLRKAILAGDASEKPGWTRVNLSYLMNDATVDFIVQSVDELAHNNARLS
jgi:selenocysteine lyase/cysteine desulfurase